MIPKSLHKNMLVSPNILVSELFVSGRVVSASDSEVECDNLPHKGEQN